MNRVQAITVNSLHSAVDKIRGFNFAEDAGAAAYVRLRKGAVDGPIVAHIKLASDQSGIIEFDSALTCEGGCYVEEVSGSVTGVLYY